MVRMRSASVFQNKRIQNGRDGVVRVGEEFSTDFAHAGELELGGLASRIELLTPEPKAAPIEIASDLPVIDAPLAAGGVVAPETMDIAITAGAKAPGRRRA